MRERVLGLLLPWIRLLAQVVANNPRADIYDLLGRPDISRMLEEGLAEAQRAAVAAVERAWPDDTASVYRLALLADVARAYAEAAAQLRATAVQAAISVPPEPFIPGIHVPGTNPDAAAAQARARAVRDALAAAVRWLGYRNDLTVSVAQTRGITEAEIAEGLQHRDLLKKWKSRRDARVCPWCRALDSSPPIPLDREFVMPAIGGHAPPRVYIDLLGPPAHPQCRCRLVLVRASEVATSNPEAPSVVGSGLTPNSGWRFIEAADVRAMPAGRYQVVMAFYGEAVRQLALSTRESLAHQDA